MKCVRFLLALILASCCSLAVLSQPQSQYAPPPAQKPDREDLRAIEDKTAELGRAIQRLRSLRDPRIEALLPEVEVFHRAAESIVKLGEFYDKDSAAKTLTVLDRGLLRARALLRGDSPWLNMTGISVARGYRSPVDGTVQPYAVTYPADYLVNAKRKWRVDVVLHGRNPKLTEVAFLAQHSTDKPVPKDLNYVQIDIFGRGNNAYRWAGENDVYDAVTFFLTVEQLLHRANLLDETRYVLRGFSMGGAGTWHLGLHRPGYWCVLGPGAGFTTTRGYAPIPKQLPAYQEACLSIYDAVDYAENVAMMPVVAYSGEKDKQIQAARNIEERLEKLGLSKSMTHLIAPGLEHKFPPEWQEKTEVEYAKYAEMGRNRHPDKVRFVTYTLRYPECDWLTILALDRHYQQARVETEVNKNAIPLTCTAKTTNVRALKIRLPGSALRLPVPVTIDGQTLTVRPLPDAERQLSLFLEKQEGRWRGVFLERLVTERLRQPQKQAGLQGPIDDAFMTSFLCVQGTGDAWHKGTEKYAEANLKRFREEWDRYMRGDLPIKDDVDVTSDDIANRHLILFGDPASNSILGQVLSGLPLKWTRDKITWNGKDYPAGEHIPVMIYPSPLNPSRYVVLNSGHTFHAEDFKGTNALLYPRLGDYALLKHKPDDQDDLAVEVVNAGLFDDYWKMNGEK